MWSNLSEGKAVKKDPVEVNMRTCGVIEYYGYPCEIHEVTTSDGYILELHRIPHGIHETANAINGTRKVVFLQHGLIDSSFTWVSNPPDQSLAYILAEAGYDVWIGNSRGNTYSSKHVYMTVDDEKFWDFSFTEMALHDLPACVTYLQHTTGEKKIDYIGHSQGTMIAFAGFSSNTTLGAQIRLFIALAPVATVKHVKGFMKVLGYGSGIAKYIVTLLGRKSFLPSSWVTKMVAKIVCGAFAPRLCGDIMFLITGFDNSNLLKERMPVYLAHTPAGTSVKDMLHFSQNHETGKFQMYDYGWNGNMHKYMQPYPPAFNIAKMNVPLALFSGTDDWLATPGDISESIRSALSNKIMHDQEEDSYNHMDFVWGKNTPSTIYNNVLLLLQGKDPVITNSKQTTFIATNNKQTKA